MSEVIEASRTIEPETQPSFNKPGGHLIAYAVENYNMSPERTLFWENELANLKISDEAYRRRMNGFFGTLSGLAKDRDPNITIEIYPLLGYKGPGERVMSQIWKDRHLSLKDFIYYLFQLKKIQRKKGKKWYKDPEAKALYYSLIDEVRQKNREKSTNSQT